MFTNIVSALFEKYPNDHWGKQFMDEFHANLNSFTLNGQKFTFSSVSVGLGGYRFFVNCPRCGSKRLILYLPKGYTSHEQQYLCVKCHNLRMFSKQNFSTTRYKKVVRPLKRMQRIKKKLLERYLKPEDSTKLLEEYEMLEKTLKNSPDYRLWKFQMEHKNLARTGL